MSDNVVALPGSDWQRMASDPRSRDIEPVAVLQGTLETVQKVPMQQLVVIGLTESGQLYAASTSPYIADTLLLLARIRKRLMAQFDEDAFGTEGEED